MATRAAPIKLNELAPLLRKLGAAGPAALKRGLLSGALRGVVEMQRRGDQAGVFDRGGFRRSWQALPTERGATLRNNAPYAGVVEEGRRPGSRMPPLRVVQRWAARKLALTPKEAKAAAFPIALAIARRGIKGKHLLDAALPALVQLVRAECVSALQAAVAKVAGGRP